MTKSEKIQRLLSRNVDTVIEKAHLKRALESGKKLRVKLGIDPTGNELHLGHTVVLHKLKEFQELGHKVVFIIGDFTATIGDPTGKSKTRPPLTEREIKANMKDYLAQAGMVLDIKKTEVRYNSEWHNKLTEKKLVGLLMLTTAAQILERNDFAERTKSGEAVGMHELLYPIMQAYDSVAIKADVELGGTDQLFNNLMGRTIMERLNLKPQDVLTVPLIEGTDGKEKMSKSLGNYIGLREKPADMFGKLMSIPDTLIIRYLRLATDLPEAEIKKHEATLKKDTNPRDIKELLALEITKRYHGKEKAEKAREEFARVFRKKERPSKIPELRITNYELRITDLLVEAGIKSKGEARRLIKQNGVRVNEETKSDPLETLNLKPGDILNIGKRTFLRIK